MKNTLTRTLALMMALLLALSVCAFADETTTIPDETDVTATMPGETVETVEPTDDLIDDVDETPAEAEGELEEEPVEVEEELVVEDAPEIVTDEAMMNLVSYVEICGEPIQPGTYKFDMNPLNGQQAGTVTYDAETNTLTLDGAEIQTGDSAYGISFYKPGGKLTINLIRSNRVTGGHFGIYTSGAELKIKGEANSSLTINAVAGIDVSDGAFTVSGGKMTIKAGDYGIAVSDGAFTVSGGEMTSNAGEYGIVVWNGEFTVSGGKIESTSSRYVGIDIGGSGSLVFTDGSLTATGAEGKYGLMFETLSDGAIKPKMDIGKGEIRCGASATDNKVVTADEYLGYFKDGSIVNNMPKYFHVSIPEKEAEPTPTPTATPAPTPAPTPTPTPTPAPEADGLIVASMKTAGKTGFKFTWTPIAGAEGYDVFLANCGEKDYDVVATAAGSAKSIKVPNLKKYTAYKGYVRAWQMVNGQKTYITAASPMMHAITGGNTNKYTNPKKITVKKAKFTLKPGKTAKIRASVKKLENSKNLLDHEAKVRYYSSNPAVATVNAKGKITAVAAGKCKIYVIAINGLRKAVTVKVKQK